MAQHAQLPVESLASNPLLKCFLEEPENQRLYGAGAREELERRFADHYFEIRFLGFIRKHIHYEAQHLLRKTRTKQQIEPLWLNRTVGDEEGTGLEALDLIEDPAESVEDKVIARTDALEDITPHEGLHRALQSLSPRQQLILQLLFVECLTEQEAAEVLEISQQAVNKCKRKALAEIKRLLEAR
ncbi:RNA polymerase sigma factor (sigma-70 family) [Tumebacillus sp. BK434]|uniref:RNA polymerase sigma factor n=1 Tax=Tumebacillus sp. BK434 TaxID=2512169 RepID=UPI0010478241|nr:sigma-70 family RNA polymerase sigma factor [Tumebacillus sp. BK434]TCP53831.1 RNA polymerase sigma factor (sigma-70 family) [Tumebacillus sp. BK434]